MDKQTIRRYLILSTLYRTSVSFIAATYVTFLISHGLNLFEVSLVNFVFHSVMFIAEIPTGAIADVYGRRISFFCACTLNGLGLIAYAFSSSFYGFALSEAVIAVGATCATGAFQAWLVDRLRHFGYDQKIARVITKERQIDTAAGIVAALIGSSLAMRNQGLPWLVGGMLSLVAAGLAAAWMKEEYLKPGVKTGRKGFAEIGQTAVAGIRFANQQKNIRFILLISALQSFAVMAPNMQWQPMFLPHLGSKQHLGFVWAGIALSVMVGAAAWQRLLKSVRCEKTALTVAQIAVAGGIAGTALFAQHFPLSIAIFMAHEAARGVWRPLKEVYLHDNIPHAHQRATIVSCEAIIHHLGGATGLLMSGYLASITSMCETWMLTGCILAIGTLIVFRNRER